LNNTILDHDIGSRVYIIGRINNRSVPNHNPHQAWYPLVSSRSRIVEKTLSQKKGPLGYAKEACLNVDI
jgi:hypothetical protein